MKKILKLSLVCMLMQTAYAEESVWDKPTPKLEKPADMTVYRSPSCGCCGKWIAHMEKQGFVIKDILTEDVAAMKQQLGVPENLQSCHTALVDGMVVEGHVPAGDVKKALKAKLMGLAAPNMPAGSPGMEMPGRNAKFSVLAFDKDGHSKKFSEY